MRWVAILIALEAVAAATPGKPVRKPPPPELPDDRLSTFVDAVLLDKAGDYDGAISRYRSAADGKEHAAIVYNIADLFRRSEVPEEAIRNYKKYLELAPQAPDRAAVQALIGQLENTPATLVVDGEDLDAVVFVDGKRAGASPLVTTLADGWHTIDRIGPHSYRQDHFDAKPLAYKHVTAYRGDEKGNVVLSTSASWGGSWRDKGVMFRMNDRFELPPGKYETYFEKPGRACSQVVFQVPAKGMVYVFIDAPRERKRDDGCVPIKVTVQNLPFGGPP